VHATNSRKEAKEREEGGGQASGREHAFPHRVQGAKRKGPGAEIEGVSLAQTAELVSVARCFLHMGR